VPQLIDRAARVANAALRPLGIAILRRRNVENQQSDPSLADALAALENRLGTLEKSAAKRAHLESLARYATRAHWRLVDQMESVNPPPSETACPLCSHRGLASSFELMESECKFEGGHLRRFLCPSCGVIFGPRKMFDLNEAMVHLEYSNLYRLYAEGDSTEAEMRVFRSLQPRREGRYLNFGCGGGWSRSIDTLRSEGWDVLGFEPNCATVSSHVITSWTELASRRFDGIYSHDVIEHLFDPAATLRQLSGILAPGGLQAHATPCYEYRYEYSRFHVFFYTGRSPEVLAERAGLKIAGWVRESDLIICLFESA